MEEDQTYYAAGYDRSVANTHQDRDTANSCGYMVQYIQPGSKILDVGCGPGTITYSLGALVDPEQGGEVLGIEPTQQVLDHAESLRPKDKNLRHVKFQRASALKLPFQDAQFDIVHVHQVIIHLKDPLAAMKEMRRVLKPNGYLCVRDAELNTIIVYPELYSQPLQAYFHKIRGKDTSPHGGSRLKELALQAGFSADKIKHTFSTWCYSHQDEKEQFATKHLLRLKNVHFSDKDLYSPEQIAHAFNLWADDPSGVVVLIHGEIVAQKT